MKVSFFIETVNNTLVFENSRKNQREKDQLVSIVPIISKIFGKILTKQV